VESVPGQDGRRGRDADVRFRAARGQDAEGTAESEIVDQGSATDPRVQISGAALQAGRASRVLQQRQIVRDCVDVESQVDGPMSHNFGALRSPRFVAVVAVIAVVAVVAVAAGAHIAVHPLHVKLDGVLLRVRDP